LTPVAFLFFQCRFICGDQYYYLRFARASP